jgi:hypothetical protein
MSWGTIHCYEKYEPKIGKSKANTMRKSLNNRPHKKKKKCFKNVSVPAMIVM